MRAVLPVLFTLASGSVALADEPIADREAWLASAVEAIETGQLTSLQEQLDGTLGPEMHDDVMLTVMPLKQALGEEPALYVDHLETEMLGESFETHQYAAYYGERSFVFYTFTFARLDDGWHIYDLTYTDDFAEARE
ncbi:MAG: hypothetical protein AAGE18_01110 [Pseudomonadota bacterium]